MSKTVVSGLYRDFPNFVFLTDFDASESVLGSFFRVLCENLTYKHISQL